MFTRQIALNKLIKYYLSKSETRFMPDTEVSKFSSLFLTKAVAFAIFILCCVVGYIVLIIKYWPSYNWAPISFVTLYLLLLIYFSYRLSVYSLVRVTVAPDGLSWENLVTKKLMIIAYEDITHVTNLNSQVSRYSVRGSSMSYFRLQIELSTDERLSFTSLQFDNYKKLKNAIWEYRQLDRDSRKLHDDSTGEI